MASGAGFAGSAGDVDRGDPAMVARVGAPFRFHKP
jgi:hypothetical protein